MWDVIVIGGGPAGMMAAIASANHGKKVLLLDHNEKLGKKLFITGKGRCNITNACDIEDLFPNVMRNRRFLYSAFYTFSNYDMMAFLEQEGLSIKVERGNRVFPSSDHSSDVIRTLKNACDKRGITVKLHTHVRKIIAGENKCKGVQLSDGTEILSDAVVLATGGLSYASTGSDGSGYRLAEMLGHHMTKKRPSLVPFDIKEDAPRRMQGLSLRNVSVSISDGEKVLYKEFGEMLFTHFGVSGPLILSASSIINDAMDGKNLRLSIDLKPALSEKQLDERILRDFKAAGNKQLKNVLGKLLPEKMIPVMIEFAGVHPEKKVNEITKEERHSLVQTIKRFSLTITGLRDYNEAIITRGGISVKEVNASTMESKLIRGLYFAGEILDLDALTGGYNLQIAWSTGYLAGNSI